MNKGFTLIELLVVVLIIGILAAIALPQYQKAVERSRMAEAIQYLGNFATAQSIYYMHHNDFSKDELDEDMVLPTPGDAFAYLQGGQHGVSVHLNAVRQSGIYQGGTLTITILADGTIQKVCEDPEGKTGFCTMAQPAGYELDDTTDDGDENSGGNDFSPPVLSACKYGYKWDPDQGKCVRDYSDL